MIRLRAKALRPTPAGGTPPSTSPPNLTPSKHNLRNLGTFYFARVAPNDWTSPTNDGLWQDGFKTLFDPCPPGWRVSKSGGGLLSPWGHFAIDLDISNFGTPNATDTSYDTTAASGYHFYRYGTSGSTAWHPAGGFRLRTDEGLDCTGTYGYYWSTSRAPDTAQIYTFGYHMTKAFPYYAVPAIYGFSVRCVRE